VHSAYSKRNESGLLKAGPTQVTNPSPLGLNPTKAAGPIPAVPVPDRLSKRLFEEGFTIFVLRFAGGVQICAAPVIVPVINFFPSRLKATRMIRSRGESGGKIVLFVGPAFQFKGNALSNDQYRCSFFGFGLNARKNPLGSPLVALAKAFRLLCGVIEAPATLVLH
jgi:hypothetical protein